MMFNIASVSVALSLSFAVYACAICDRCGRLERSSTLPHLSLHPRIVLAAFAVLAVSDCCCSTTNELFVRIVGTYVAEDRNS